MGQLMSLKGTRFFDKEGSVNQAIPAGYTECIENKYLTVH